MGSFIAAFDYQINVCDQALTQATLPQLTQEQNWNYFINSLPNSTMITFIQQTTSEVNYPRNDPTKLKSGALAAFAALAARKMPAATEPCVVPKSCQSMIVTCSVPKGVNMHTKGTQPGAQEQRKCFDFQKPSGCRFGDRCRFSHSDGNKRKNDSGSDGNTHKKHKADTPKPTSSEKCRNFARTGRCKYGKNCKFSHAPDAATSANVGGAAAKVLHVNKQPEFYDWEHQQTSTPSPSCKAVSILATCLNGNTTAAGVERGATYLDSGAEIHCTGELKQRKDEIPVPVVKTTGAHGSGELRTAYKSKYFSDPIYHLEGLPCTLISQGLAAEDYNIDFNSRSLQYVFSSKHDATQTLIFEKKGNLWQLCHA
jgi:hypothetical protein